MVVKLKPAYLETLAVGEHTLTAIFDDGNNPTAKFTIVAAPQPQPQPAPAKAAPATTPAKTTPRTADDAAPAGYALLALAAAACALGARRRLTAAPAGKHAGR